MTMDDPDARCDSMPSSRPAFSKIHPPMPSRAPQSCTPTILPIVIAPAALRPLAFRTFTKKHNLTLTSSALQLITQFVGSRCGSGWREDGLAEKALDGIAKYWKTSGGGIIVSDDGDALKIALRHTEDFMDGNKVHNHTGPEQDANRTLDRQNIVRATTTRLPEPGGADGRDAYISSDANIEVSRGSNHSTGPDKWFKVIGAFDQPRLNYDITKKHFDLAFDSPSLLPHPAHKTQSFRYRYNLIHQRLLRNESFQASAMLSPQIVPLPNSSSDRGARQQAYKLTPVSNLLGRNGSTHILLGLLTVSPTGQLVLNDLTGSIELDIQHARPVPEDGAWFTPGMIVLVEGLYEERNSHAGLGLDNNTGIGGSLGGRFVAFSVGGPPCERRVDTLGLSSIDADGNGTGGGFGWVDFLGVGSERATGAMMRQIEKSALEHDTLHLGNEGRSRIVILGEVNLDNGTTLQALRKIFGQYAARPANQIPIAIVLIGNFSGYAVMSGGNRSGSVEYKEYFDAFASALLEFPTLLCNSAFVFVPGHHDPWASSFSAGAAPLVPRAPVPDLFTNRVKRAFATAKSDAERSTGTRTTGEAIWSTNPTRLSLFGPVQELVIYRDDMLGRLRRNAMVFSPLQKGDQDESCDMASIDLSEDSISSKNDRRGDPEWVDPTVQSAAARVPESHIEGICTEDVSTDLHTVRKLVKTILDQGYLSPFPFSERPVLWDYAGSLQLYPLPTALVLMDPEAPSYTISYQGCVVMNPGPLTSCRQRNMVQWIEFDVKNRQGVIKKDRL